MGIVDGLMGFMGNMAALQHQANANELARRDQFFFYNDQKAYNDPSAVMYRNRMAGINPYGDFINTPISQPTPVNTGQGIGEIAGNAATALGNAANNYLQKLYYKLEVKRLQLETKKTDKEIESIDEKNLLVKSQTIYQDLINVLTKGTNDYKIQYSKAEAEDMINKALISASQASHQDKLLDATINQIYSLIGLQDAQKANTRYQTNTFLPKQLNIQERAAEDTHNISVEELARLQLDNADIHAIDEILNKIGKGDDNGLRNFLKVALMVLRKMSRK